MKFVIDSFNLELSVSINQVLTQYVDNSQDSNLVIDLIFLWADAEKFNNHQILPDLWSPSDYTFYWYILSLKKKSFKIENRLLSRCHMLSSPIWKIYPCDDSASPTSIIQACLPWWPSFLQHTLMAVMQ